MPFEPFRHCFYYRNNLLHLPTQAKAASTSTTAQNVPYHYVEHSLGYAVGGWRLPQDWRFDREKLLDWLLSLQDWQRIKGVMQVADGWVSINLIPNQIQMSSHTGSTDNRLELIASADTDWPSLEMQLLACLITNA